MAKNGPTVEMSRRYLLKTAMVAGSWAADAPAIEHPLMKPGRFTDKGRCPNCGMGLNMWGRTRHAFSNSEGAHETCSIRCLADMSRNLGEEPHDVRAALYLEPEKTVPADEAVYVVGSSAAGTMTMRSKVALPLPARRTPRPSSLATAARPWTSRTRSARPPPNLMRPGRGSRRTARKRARSRSPAPRTAAWSAVCTRPNIRTSMPR